MSILKFLFGRNKTSAATVSESNMSEATSANTRRILIIAANPGVSPTTGWPIGFWWAELTHPFHAFKQAGYAIDIVSQKAAISSRIPTLTPKTQAVIPPRTFSRWVSRNHPPTQRF